MSKVIKLLFIIGCFTLFSAVHADILRPVWLDNGQGVCTKHDYQAFTFAKLEGKKLTCVYIDANQGYYFRIPTGTFRPGWEPAADRVCTKDDNCHVFQITP